MYNYLILFSTIYNYSDINPIIKNTVTISTKIMISFDRITVILREPEPKSSSLSRPSEWGDGRGASETPVQTKYGVNQNARLTDDCRRQQNAFTFWRTRKSHSPWTDDRSKIFKISEYRVQRKLVSTQWWTWKYLTIGWFLFDFCNQRRNIIWKVLFGNWRWTSESSPMVHDRSRGCAEDVGPV